MTFSLQIFGTWASKPITMLGYCFSSSNLEALGSMAPLVLLLPLAWRLFWDLEMIPMSSHM